MVDCWKSNRFEFAELEDMFIINMAHHNNNPELLARELESTLRNSRSCSNFVIIRTLQFCVYLKDPYPWIYGFLCNI